MSTHTEPHVLTGAASPAPPAPGEKPDKPYASLLIVLGLIMIAFTLGRALRRRRRAALRASEEALDASRGASARERSAVVPAAPAAPGVQAREMCEEMIADLARTAREVNAQLDTKIRVLEVLIRQADERIARLGGAGTDAPQRAPDGRAAPSAPEPAEEARHAPVYRLAEEGLSTREIAQRTGLGQGEVELILNLRRGRDT